MVRCFVGLLTPKELNQNIRKVLEEIKKLPMKCKFVEEQNFHICLSFLGEVEKSEIEKIKKILDSITFNFKSFEVLVEGIKLIPNKNFLRVIAFDVRDESKKIEELRRMIVNTIGGDSKPPHITLCRVKSVEKRDFVTKKLEEMKDLSIGKMKIDRLQIIKSELRKEGPVYSILHESKFKE
ncbi:MAG: RNA 2',3'-cyclic phosphodiesterase [Candidatus Aenigmarchaeota archaeon]|nr:RNA 2',3'-cyclic phosphodiesterase [Candidatus Aenigmarchaeota archaeon]